MSTKMNTLEIGTEVYNGGDMANVEHFGIITAIKNGQYQITPDADSDRKNPYWVPFCAFSPVYKGHGGTRFVTKEAYDLFQAERLKEMQERYAKMFSK